MPSVAEMRKLINIYGPHFEAKIKKMSDAQVVAVYLKFKEAGKIK